MFRTEEEAKMLLCPYVFGKKSPFCVTSKCMAWANFSSVFKDKIGNRIYSSTIQKLEENKKNPELIRCGYCLRLQDQFELND